MTVWREAEAPDGSKWVSLDPDGRDLTERLWMPAYLWDERPGQNWDQTVVPLTKTEIAREVAAGPARGQHGFLFDPVLASRLACLAIASGVRSRDGTLGLPSQWLHPVADAFFGSVATDRDGPVDETAHAEPILANARWREWGDAPTDGAQVLAYRADAGVFMVFYTSVADEWFVVGTGEDIDGDLPTHWMPTPAHPGGGTS